MFKNKIKLLFVVVASGVLLAACSNKKPDYNGNKILVQPANNVEEGSFKLSNISKPPVKSTFEPKIVTLDTKLPSPYSESLPLLHQSIYKDLLNTVEKGGKTFVPSGKINPEEMKHLMRIILLDEPTSYPLKRSYTYELDKDKNIKQVNLNYYDVLLTEGFKKVYNDIKKANSSVKNTDFSLSEAFFSKYLEKGTQNNSEELTQLVKGYLFEQGVNVNLETEETKSKIDELSKELNSHLKDTALGPTLSTLATEEGFAKAYVMSLRENGVKSLTVYGERTSSIDKDFNGVRKFGEFKETEELVNEGIKVTVSSDELNAWNMVSLDSGWYNFDIMLSKAINNKVHSLSPNIKVLENTPTLFGFSDEQISLSKLSHYNNDILGVTPMSYDDLASYFRYKKDEIGFIENSSPSRLSDDFAPLAAANLTTRKDSYLLTFSESETYNYFVLSYDMLIKKYIKQKLISIYAYDALVIPEIQGVYFYNIR